MCGRGDPPVGAADPSGCSSTVFSTTTTATYVRLAIAVSMHSMRRGWFQLRGNAFALCLQQVHNKIGGRTCTKDNRVAMCWCAVSSVRQGAVTQHMLRWPVRRVAAIYIGIRVRVMLA
jgi:hypothetical protein